MEIKTIKLFCLENEDHFLFHSEMEKLMQGHSTESIGLELLYTAYKQAIEKERQSSTQLYKTQYAETVVKADEKRFSTLWGFSSVVKSNELHYVSKIGNAAGRILFVLDLFNGINHNTYVEETAAIDMLLNELQKNYDYDIALLELNGWLNELKRNNEAVKEIIKKQYSEASEKLTVKMKKARNETDTIYNKVIQRIAALAIVHGEESYVFFMDDLNSHIEKYNRTFSVKRHYDGQHTKKIPG